MMQETPFSSFLELVTLDQGIEELRENHSAIIKEINDCKQKQLQAEHTLTEARGTMHDAQKQVDFHELEMKTFDSQEKEQKKRLETVSNQKEYQSIKAEIDALHKKQHDLEDILLSSWNSLEAAKNNYGLMVQSTEDAIMKLQLIMQEKEEQGTLLEQTISERCQIRDKKEREVPAEWLEKYTLMRARVKNPVVPVVNGTCSACFYKVNEQDLLLLKRNKLVQCKDCYRLLYDERLMQ